MEYKSGQECSGDDDEPLMDQIVNQHEFGVATAGNNAGQTSALVSCADDPGVAEVREALPGMLVTDGGETTVALATRYGEKSACWAL